MAAASREYLGLLREIFNSFRDTGLNVMCKFSRGYIEYLKSTGDNIILIAIRTVSGKTDTFTSMLPH